VQFLASKAKTEEEFFHTFNALYDSGRQLVVTCDRLPRQLVGVEERLRERFESGLVAELAPPDRGTRLAILRKRAALDRVEIPDPVVLDLIADRVTDNVRSLEGALIRIVAHHSLTGRPLDRDLTRSVLDEIHPVAGTPATGELSIEAIQATVAAYFDVTGEQLLSQSRTARIVWARQVAIHLGREFTHASLQALGSAFGGRDHATVLYACRRVSERITTSTADAADVQAITTQIARTVDDRAC
jgi:chromosomal replication initiator protein